MGKPRLMVCMHNVNQMQSRYTLIVGVRWWPVIMRSSSHFFAAWDIVRSLHRSQMCEKEPRKSLWESTGITHMFGGEGGWCMRIFELFAASLFPFSMPRIFVSFLFGVINHDQVSLEGRAKKWMALLSIRIHLVIPVLPKDHTRIPERRAMIHSNNTFVPRRNRNNLE